MLVLSRFEDEVIVLSNGIEIKVCEIVRLNGRKQVRLGITAPEDVIICRSEVIEKTKLSMPAVSS